MSYAFDYIEYLQNLLRKSGTVYDEQDKFSGKLSLKKWKTFQRILEYYPPDSYINEQKIHLFIISKSNGEYKFQMSGVSGHIWRNQEIDWKYFEELFKVIDQIQNNILRHVGSDISKLIMTYLRYPLQSLYVNRSLDYINRISNIIDKDSYYDICTTSFQKGGCSCADLFDIVYKLII